jgi:hypothetical protein
VGRQEVRPAVVGFVVSVAVVILASVGGGGAPGDDNVVPEWLTGSDEGAVFDEEAGLPDWLFDYNLHAPVIGVIYSPPDRRPTLVGLSESQRLMDSLSPGVRASYEGALLEREEAEYAAVAKIRMRRLSEDRALRE